MLRAELFGVLRSDGGAPSLLALGLAHHSDQGSQPALKESSQHTPAGMQDGLTYLRAMQRGADGLRAGRCAARPARVLLLPGEQHYNPVDVVPGGLALTLVDSAPAAPYTACSPPGRRTPASKPRRTSSGPIHVPTGLLYCTAEVVHAGRRDATAQARLHDADDRLYAHGLSTCLILAAEPARP